MLICYIVRADLRSDIGQMNIAHSVKLHWCGPPCGKRTIFIGRLFICGSESGSPQA